MAVDRAYFEVIARQQTAALSQVTASINQMTQAFQRMTSLSATTATASGRAASGVQNVGSAARSAAPPIGTVTAATTGAAKGFTELGSTANASARDVQNATQKMATSGNQVKSLGATYVLAQATRMLGEQIQSATKSALSFDQTMHNVNTISRLSDEGLQGLTQAVLEMGGSAEAGGAKASDLAAALYDVFSAGIGVDTTRTETENINEALDVVAVAAKAASAGLATTQETANGFLKVINAYGLQKAPIETLTGVSDQMFESVNAGIFTFKELANAIGVVAGPAHQAGVSIEELLAALAQSSRQTQDVQASAYGLGQVLIQLTNAKGPAQDMWKTIADATGYAGETLDITTLKAKGFEQFLLDIIDASGKYAEQTGVDIGDVLDKIDGGARSLRTFVALANDGGREFAAMLEQIKSASAIKAGPFAGLGATTAAYSEQLKAAQKQQDIAGASVERLGIKIGATLLPQITSAAEFTRQLADALSSLDPAVLQGAVSVAILVTSIGALTTAWRLAQLAVPIFFSPLGIAIIGGIALAVLAVQTNFAGVRDVIGQAAANVGHFKDAAGEVLGVLTGARPEAGGNLRSVLGNAPAEGLMQRVAGIREGIGGLQMGLSVPVGYELAARNPANVGGSQVFAAMFALAQRAKGAWESLQPTLTRIGQSVQHLWDVISGVVGRFFDYLAQHAPDIAATIGSAIDALLPAAQTLGAILAGAVDLIAAVIQHAADFIGWLNESSPPAEALKAVIVGIGFALGVTFAVGKVAMIMEVVKAFALVKIAAIQAGIAQLIAFGPVALILIAIGAAIYLIVRNWDFLASTVGKVLPGIAAAVINFLAAPLNTVITVINGIITGINAVAEFAGLDVHLPLIPTIDGNKLVAAVQDAIDNVRGVVRIPVTASAEGIAAETGSPANAAQAHKAAQDLAQDVVDGFEGTISTAAKTTTPEVSADFLNAALARMREVADAKSPSAVTASLGDDIVDGLVLGIRRSASRADDAITSLLGPLDASGRPIVVERRVSVAIDVTSSDGTLRGASVEAVQAIFDRSLGDVLRAAGQQLQASTGRGLSSPAAGGAALVP